MFGEKGCVRCHSISGSGQSLGPDLRTIGSARTFQDLTAALWNHLPDMNRRMADLEIERPHLSEREAGDLFAYLYTLGYFDTAGDAERGKRLFTDLSCIRCHQVGGVGGVVGPVLDHVGARGVPIEVAAAMWNHGPAMIEAAEVRGISRPRMSGPDLVDLIAFLQSTADEVSGENLYVLPGDAAAGARVIVDRQCIECHGNPSAGGTIAPVLSGLSRGASLIDFVALMWNKAPAMIEALRARDLEFPHLQAQDFANVVAYLYSVDYFSAGGKASSGRRLIDSKGCADCHTPGDLSSIPGLGHPSSVTAALWNHLAVLEANEDSVPDWPSLTGREIGDLMAFFQASSP
ncbi:MAG: c-type cytochrome [Gemmatimonadetes bacterium]|nr:c-type cytochrome [Gemmatimonadota bacterium]